NIPGLPKVGEKTAQAMLQQIPSIDAIYENVDAVSELSFRGAKTMPAKLNEYKDQLLMSRELATIKLDVAMELQPEELTIQTADSEKLAELYSRCEFRRWLGELMESGAATDQALGKAEVEKPVSDINRDAYRVLMTEEEVSDYLTSLKK
ncbi:5'-3' exonuclease H3TH domain-containing protein, partial [Idiomarina abyssalis]